MSKTTAKKNRLKMQREGKRNPEYNRLHWNGVVPVVKTTPTLSERVRKIDNKHKKWNQSQNSDDSIFYYAV